MRLPKSLETESEETKEKNFSLLVKPVNVTDRSNCANFRITLPAELLQNPLAKTKLSPNFSTDDDVAEALAAV